MVIVKRVFFTLLLISLMYILSGQDEVVERVEVVNREVVVRVFDGGKPVPGLKRGDFTLMENGKPVTITSCRMERRSLALAEPEGTLEASLKQKRGRLFLFLLWWNEENKDWPAAWDYFLNSIYRPDDRVILASDRRVIQLKTPQLEKTKLDDFFRGIRVDLKRKQQDKSGMIREIEIGVRDFDLSLKENAKIKDSSPLKKNELVLLEQFKSSYLGKLEEYRLKRLRAQPGMMQRLAEALRKVETEKWAFVFLQNERLPLVDMQSSLVTHTPMKLSMQLKLNDFIIECDRRIRMASGMAVHVRDLRSMFIGAGATFHLFLSDARDEKLNSDLLRWLPVFSSWESAFRGIARDTGGDVQDTTRLKSALEKAAARPDIYYVLTYKPKAPGMGKPKIKMQVSRPGLKVVYARKLRPREIRPLKLSEPVWKEGVLRFNISDYLRETGEAGVIAGDVHVKVSSETLDGQPLEFEKVLHPAEESASLEMKVHFPESGDYILTVAVTDRLSGNTAHGYTRASIAPSEPEAPEPMDPKLKSVLDKAAIYCGKLQKAAFRFTCTEVVDEMVLKRNTVTKRVEPEDTRWLYDYQVVADAGKVTEQRILVRRGHKKVNIPDAKLETRFKAHYSVFLPITLLGEKNRPDYTYTLLETVRLKKRTCAVIEVTPRKFSKGPIAQGKTWVDVENGSVLKIEMDPRGVAGSAALEAAARGMSAKLDLKAIHWYLELRKGLRFPSSAAFSESYIFTKRLVKKKVVFSTGENSSQDVYIPKFESGFRKVEFYIISQIYKKYRYFEVDTKVEEELPQ